MTISNRFFASFVASDIYLLFFLMKKSVAFIYFLWCTALGWVHTNVNINTKERYERNMSEDCNEKKIIFYKHFSVFGPYQIISLYTILYPINYISWQNSLWSSLFFNIFIQSKYSSCSYICNSFHLLLCCQVILLICLLLSKILTMILCHSISKQRFGQI